MRASYWLLGLLLFLFFPASRSGRTPLKAFFLARTPIGVFVIICLFVGLDSSGHNYLTIKDL